MKAMITRKVGMTSIIDANGSVTAVTLLSASPVTVTQIKSVESDGYMSVQLGAEQGKSLNKPAKGHLNKSGGDSRLLREFRIDELPPELVVGKTLDLNVFDVGDKVQVTARSKGKGWAGTIKRHNFHRQRKTHGGKGNTRKVGSIGSMYPQKIFKGKKMAGQMGGEQVTVKNLRIALIDGELGLIGVAGAVPGPKKGVVIVKGLSR
jgi:large subunit ribosomal protein L3